MFVEKFSENNRSVLIVWIGDINLHSISQKFIGNNLKKDEVLFIVPEYISFENSDFNYIGVPQFKLNKRMNAHDYADILKSAAEPAIKKCKGMLKSKSEMDLVLLIVESWEECTQKAFKYIKLGELLSSNISWMKKVDELSNIKKIISFDCELDKWLCFGDPYSYDNKGANGDYYIQFHVSGANHEDKTSIPGTYEEEFFSSIAMSIQYDWKIGNSMMYEADYIKNIIREHIGADTTLTLCEYTHFWSDDFGQT